MAEMKMKKGGSDKQGYMHEGLKTKNPPAYDSSRKPIGSMHPSVDAEDRPGGVAEVTPTTIGPRTA